MNLEFRKLKKDDVYQFLKWGRHDDPRFYHYHFPFYDKESFEDWFHMKQKLFTRKVYGLFDDGELVSFVTLKKINFFNQSAELGISVDPNKISKGYGESTLKYFLEYVFKHYPIKKMRLRVSEFNHRARKCYEKVGFRKVIERVELFEEQSFKELIIDAFPEQFELRDGRLYTRFVIMEIEKNNFLKC